MAREEDDALPPLGEGTLEALEDAKKGKSRNFLLICKGITPKYLLVKKKAIKKSEIAEAKKLGYKGEPYVGVISGRGVELVFNLAIEDGYQDAPCKEQIFKDFLATHAEMKAKPSFAIVQSVAEFQTEDDDDSPAAPAAPGSEPAASTAAPASAAPASPESASPASAPAAAESSTPAAPASPGAIPNAPTLPDGAKEKLEGALNKLLPQLKDAISRFPDRKEEILKPVSKIKEDIAAKNFQDAKDGLIRLNELLKTLDSKQAAAPAVGTPNLDEQKWKALLAQLTPKFRQVVSGGLGDVEKFKLVLSRIAEAAEKRDFVTATKGGEQLLAALDRTIVGSQAGAASQPTAPGTPGATSAPAAAASPSPAASPAPATEDSEAANFQKLFDALEEKFQKAVRGQFGDTSKFRAAISFISERGANGQYESALNAITRLDKALDEALAAGKKETDVIPKGIVETRKKFLLSRWQQLLKDATVEVRKLAAPISKLVPDEEPSELISGIIDSIEQLTDKLSNAIVGAQSATGEDPKPLEKALAAIVDFRGRLANDPILNLLDEAKSSLGVDVGVRRMLESTLNELEAKLAN